jgi:hypothetical protein
MNIRILLYQMGSMKAAIIQVQKLQLGMLIQKILTYTEASGRSYNLAIASWFCKPRAADQQL